MSWCLDSMERSHFHYFGVWNSPYICAKSSSYILIFATKMQLLVCVVTNLDALVLNETVF
jgi:hypothetical protein